MEALYVSVTCLVLLQCDHRWINFDVEWKVQTNGLLWRLQLWNLDRWAKISSL